MAASLSLIVAKDGAGSTVVGGIQALDLSGAGTGPWSVANILVDGLAGIQRAAVVAVNTAPVTATHPALVVGIRPDGNAVTASIAAAQTLATVTTVSTVTNLGTIAGVAPAFGSGANGATVLRTALATDSPGVITTGTAGSASSQVLTVQGVASMTPVRIQAAACTTGTQSIVASNAGSVTVLAANAVRLGASVFNDSTQICYLLLTTGGTASATVYSVQLAANSYYEVPFGYTGALIGIWASANGNARVMEYAA